MMSLIKNDSVRVNQAEIILQVISQKNQQSKFNILKNCLLEFVIMYCIVLYW